MKIRTLSLQRAKALVDRHQDRDFSLSLRQLKVPVIPVGPTCLQAFREYNLFAILLVLGSKKIVGSLSRDAFSLPPTEREILGKINGFSNVLRNRSLKILAEAHCRWAFPEEKFGNIAAKLMAVEHCLSRQRTRIEAVFYADFLGGNDPGLAERGVQNDKAFAELHSLSGVLEDLDALVSSGEERDDPA